MDTDATRYQNVMHKIRMTDVTRALELEETLEDKRKQLPPMMTTTLAAVVLLGNN